MRRFVYRKEIDHLFDQHKIDQKERDRIKNELFVHGFKEVKQLHLNNEVLSAGQIESVINKKGNKESFISEFKSLFQVNEDLKIPPEVKRLLLDNSPVAIFIGAGVSKILNYPLWDQLADKALDFLLKKNKINHAEYEKLNYEVKDPKQKLSIFEKFCPRKDALGQEFYLDALGTPKKPPKVNPYIPIVSSSFNWIKLTSNVEYELSDALYKKEHADFNNGEGPYSGKTFPDEKSFRSERIISSNFKEENLDIDKLYYLHGELNNIGKTIFTTEDYIQNYFRKNNLSEFLRNLFENYNVIFMGYGLADFPILEAVMKDSSKKHFALLPSYFHESNIFRIKQHYYNQLHIKTIPYYIDFKGYERLYDVLESWEKEIRDELDKKPEDYFKTLDLIDEAL